MLRALNGRRGRLALVAFVALSGFLLCLLPPHAPHDSTPRAAETAGVSTAHGSTAPHAADPAPASSAPVSQVGADPSSGEHEHGHDHPPVCHTTGAQVMDVVTPLLGLLLGLVGALLGADFGLVRLDSWARVAQGWSTRPPCRLSGFPLLINLCVSRT